MRVLQGVMWAFMAVAGGFRTLARSSIESSDESGSFCISFLFAGEIADWLLHRHSSLLSASILFRSSFSSSSFVPVHLHTIVSFLLPCPSTNSDILLSYSRFQRGCELQTPYFVILRCSFVETQL